MNNLNNINLPIPTWIWSAITVALFGYILAYAFFQSRQIRLIQTKVITNVDRLITLFSYLYLILQIVIFVVVLLIL